jgi:hypothetical protein
MTKRLCLLLLVVGLWPAAAQAQDGFWDFIESFSGPGPANGVTIRGRLFCTDGDKHIYWACFNDTKDNIKWVLQLETTVPYLTTDDHARFTDTPNDKRPVHIYKYGGTMFYRFHPMVDLGAGVGWIAFSGDGVTQPGRLTLTPIALTFSPFAWKRASGRQPKASRFVHLIFSETYVTQGITAANFSSVSAYTKGGEFINNVALGVDFGGFIPWPK